MRPNQNTTDLLVSARPAGFMSSYPINLDQDKARCWKTLKTVPGSVGTATSGLCNGKCFVSAYKYKIVTKNNTEFNWFVQRGCAANPHIRKAPQKSGTVATERKRLNFYFFNPSKELANL